MALRRPEDALAQVLDRRRRDDRVLIPTRVTGRNTDGTLQLQRSDGECIARGPVCNLYEGQVITVPCGPPFAVQGAAGISLFSLRRQSSALWIEDIDPRLYWPGSWTVLATGYGFDATVRVDFLLPGSLEVNPDITVTEIRVLSSKQMEIDIFVSATSPGIAAETAAIAYGRLT